MMRGLKASGALLSWVWVFTQAGATLDPDTYEKECRNSGRGVEERLLSFDDVRKFVDENKITSPREFVTRMEKHPDFDPFLNHYVLMHKSRSKQRYSVDPAHPRVIFFHRGLIFGVTDHPTRKNRTVEIIEYQPAQHSFAFRLLDFSRKDTPFVEKPTSCNECHGKEKPLPLWATYRTWPGAHPERGRFFREFTKREGIYAVLREEHPREDAAALNGFLNTLNFHRIAHEVHTSKDFDKYRYAFLGALFRCDDLPGFLGESRAKHDATWGNTTFEMLVKEVDEKMRAQFTRRLEIAKEIGDTEAMRETQFADEDDISAIAALRYLFEPRDVNVKRFSLNFQPKEPYGYGFSEVGGGTGGLRFSFCAFLPEAVRADKELAPLFELAPNGVSTRYQESEKRFCPTLREKSIAAFR